MASNIYIYEIIAKMFESLYKFKLINGIPFAVCEDHKILLHSENHKTINPHIEEEFKKYDQLPF